MNFSKYTEKLAALAAMSNKYGANADYVLAGGGNTSFKSPDYLWIKGSGTALATIKAEDFVVMDRKALANMWTAAYPEDEAARESAVLEDMMAARIPGESRRPSVETLLHDLFPQEYVLHVHPALVNGLTCSKGGQKEMDRLFPEAVWVEACKPGYILALECKKVMDSRKTATGKDVQLLFLENHGIFFAADTVEELDVLAAHVMDTLAAQIRKQPDPTPVSFDKARATSLAGLLKALYGGEAVLFCANTMIGGYDPKTESLSPDHIVYAKAKQLALPEDADEDTVKTLFAAFEAENGYKPRIVFWNSGMFACGSTEKEAATAQVVMLDAIKVTAYAESFGGVSPMPAFLIDFIVNWEVERYRSNVSLK